MQKQTTLYIPKPCHENWDKMTPAQQGKFCSRCNKQVIDFSLMSDNQVLNFLSNHSGKLCGRFDTQQLERPLVETKIKKKKSWWMALAMPLLFLFDRSTAQDNKVGDTIYAVPSKKDINDILVGKVAICKPVKPASLIDTVISVSNKIIINGKVVDENNNPLSFASVMEKETIQGVTTNSSGNFSIEIRSYNYNATLIVSYVGYKTAEKQISFTDSDIEATIKLEPALTGEVVVVGYAVKRLKGSVGGISICRKVTSIEKIDSSIRKSLKISGFRIYPNPVSSKDAVHLEIKRAGEYQIQLLDNHSRLILIENINTIGNNAFSDFTLPSNFSAGIYYLRLIDEKKKKSYTEKLIIQ